MFLADTHIHLHAPQWQTPAAERIARSQALGVDMLVQPGVRAADWPQLIRLADEHPMVFAAPGLHPGYAHEWTSTVAAQLRALCRHPKVVAVGEIGLDGLLEVDIGLQQEVLRAQLDIARCAGLPVLLHCRKKMDLLFSLLEQNNFTPQGGILHGFSGSIEIARRALDLGLLIGIGPVLLRSNARKLPAAVRQLPATSLVLETDAPDMAKDPQTLLNVAARLASVRGWTLTETAGITTQNAAGLLLKKR
jgi:TatD DNase family protein